MFFLYFVSFISCLFPLRLKPGTICHGAEKNRHLYFLSSAEKTERDGRKRKEAIYERNLNVFNVSDKSPG